MVAMPKGSIIASYTPHVNNTARAKVIGPAAIGNNATKPANGARIIRNAASVSA